MVRILEKSSDERKDDERYAVLLGLTAQIEGEEKIRDMSGLAFTLYEGNVMVRPIINQIDLYNSQQLPNALRLAEAYESTTGEEITLRKMY